jgi:hypothetical protein
MRSRRREARGIRWWTIALWLVVSAVVIIAAAGLLGRFRAPQQSARPGAGWYQIPPAERLKALGSGLR